MFLSQLLYKAVKKFNPPIEYIYGPGTKVNVLEFFGEPLLYGGQEAFMINMYKNFESKNIHYTFCTPFDSDNKTLIQLAKDRGDDIVAYNYKFESKIRKLSIKKAAKDRGVSKSTLYKELIDIDF